MISNRKHVVLLMARLQHFVGASGGKFVRDLEAALLEGLAARVLDDAQLLDFVARLIADEVDRT